MSVIVNESENIIKVTVKEVYGKDGADGQDGAPGADGQDYQVSAFADFTGELSTASDFQPYNDYSGAEIISLSFSADKKRGATGNVRIKGGSIATNAIPSGVTVLPAGVQLTTDTSQWNELDYQYLSDTHKRIIVHILDSNFNPIQQSEPTGDTTAPTISSATIEDANPDQLVVVFSENVNATGVTGLSITGDETPSVSSVLSGSGTSTVTFQLGASVSSGSSLTLNVASTNDIADSAGNGLAATTQAITNNVAGAAPEYMYHKLDVATTDADPVTSSTDSWTTTPYPLENVGTVNRSVQNTLECVYLSQGNYLRTVNSSLSSLFQSSFNIKFDVKLDDGNPSATQYLWGIYNSTSQRIFLDIRSDGKLTFTYTEGGTSVYAQTAAAVFADGAMADFSQIEVDVPENGNIQILKDGVVQTLSGTFDGDMTGVTMSGFNSGTAKMFLGIGSANGTYTSAPGYYKEFKLEQAA